MLQHVWIPVVLVVQVLGYSSPSSTCCALLVQRSIVVVRRHGRYSYTSLHSSSSSSSIDGAMNGNKEEEVTCPFSMSFSKYRVALSPSSSSTRKNTPSMPNEKEEGVWGRFSSSLQRVKQSIIDQTILQQGKNKYDIQWIELVDNNGASSSQVERNMYAYVEFWRAIILLSSSNVTSAKQPVLLAFPQLSHVTVTRIQEIYSWYKDWQLIATSNNSTTATTTTIETLGLVHVEKIPTTGNPLSLAPQLLLTPYSQTLSSTPTGTVREKEAMTNIIQKRLKSWVRRVLVKYEICPFTKSDTRSGHGLSELGIPVAKIAYHASFATHPPQLFYDTWLAIYQMTRAGPTNISSILLAAPAFDDNFPLWAGPIFALLEASVSAVEAESTVGVVCFHPQYKVPNETSAWPGFGQMHSIAKLRSFLLSSSSSSPSLSKDNNNQVLSRSDIAAGGAWQRRTPHATINILRADQLQAAEGRRHTPSLYARNIEFLIHSVGLQKLEEDLKYERQLD